MSKTSVTRLFVGAIVAVVVGAIVAIATVVAALWNGVVAVGGPDVVTIDGEALAGSLVWLALAVAPIVGGFTAAVVSWVGALSNTARLEDKTWFVILLALGLVSLGWVAMVAYIIAGPDGTSRAAIDRGVASPTPL